MKRAGERDKDDNDGGVLGLKTYREEPLCALSEAGLEAMIRQLFQRQTRITKSNTHNEELRWRNAAKVCSQFASY
jgi:hypothetical protein